ncbi:MAG: Crp/Fnr family transcriptional regulator [Chloroflexota bacterium]|nr:Crp/Fnr family transcriptional regulator [Dehalococcoidia bacterium]MDW8252766.1 Crp/Fnr family transcriptional regulator [Chloroflexota bacterium]
MMSSSPGLLRSLALFDGLDPSSLALLEERVRARVFREGEIIFRRDDVGTALYVIRSGRVKIRLTADDGRETVLALLGPGACFGELAVLDGEPRSADAVAVDRTETVMLLRDDFLRALDQSAVLAKRMILLISQKLRQTNEQLYDLVFYDVPGRVAKRLLELAATHGVRSPVGTQIDISLTQQDLAQLIGASRESVNRALRSYVARGFIAVAHQRIVILKPEGLRRQLGSAG